MITDSEAIRLRAYVIAARNQHHVEGDLEIDDGISREHLPSYVSEGEDAGAYVKAWVWVPADEVRETEILEAMAQDAEHPAPVLGERKS